MNPDHATISHPRELKPGSLLIRVRRGGEPCSELWRVVGWLSPSKPSPGQAWSSGFLRCVSEATERQCDFGPASLVRSDFLQFRDSPQIAEHEGKKPSRKPYWWMRD